MSPLLWWSFPAVATISAIVWNAWRTRTPGPVDPLDSIQEFERLRTALSVERRAADHRPADRGDD
jgi:hypothetical protein